jgi:hypothetical protein
MLIRPFSDSPPLRFGMLCNPAFILRQPSPTFHQDDDRTRHRPGLQLLCVLPRIKIISPPAMGILVGCVSEECFAGVGLCLKRKSLFAPNDREAMAGSTPRNRSSSL